MVHEYEGMKLARSSGRYDYVTMVNKPPKPPCWRDFVQQSTPRTQKNGGLLHFTNLSQTSHKGSVTEHQLALFGLGTTSSEMTHAHTMTHRSQSHVPSHCASSSKPHKKHKSKLHRTQSEISIEKCDIPDMNRTFTLAETKPSEFGLRRTQFDPHVYIEENTKRCERWLEDVRASRPLEDVHFAQGAGVEVEVPDEECSVSGHHVSACSDVDFDSASVDHSSETISQRQARSRSRHRDKHKSRTLPLSASLIHIESIIENTETKESDGNNDTQKDTMEDNEQNQTKITHPCNHKTKQTLPQKKPPKHNQKYDSETKDKLLSGSFTTVRHSGETSSPGTVRSER